MNRTLPNLPLGIPDWMSRVPEVIGSMVIGSVGYTPPKTNMAPENGPLEKEIPIGLC